MSSSFRTFLTYLCSQIRYKWFPTNADFRQHSLFLKEYVEQLRASFYDSEIQKWMDVFLNSVHKQKLLKLIEKKTNLDRVQVILLGGQFYPEALKRLEDPPLAFTLRGELSCLRRSEKVAVIGSRKPSLEGSIVAYELARDLSLSGHTVVSGGAYGCDMAAHKGALKGYEVNQKGGTVVVMAGGLDHFYPATYQGFFLTLLQQNQAIISEKMIGMPARPFDFPVRNRIISGLSERLYLIEADERSGSMTTVQHALHQGKDVFVWSGSQKKGNQKLLAEGALPFSY